MLQCPSELHVRLRFRPTHIPTRRPSGLARRAILSGCGQQQCQASQLCRPAERRSPSNPACMKHETSIVRRSIIHGAIASVSSIRKPHKQHRQKDCPHCKHRNAPIGLPIETLPEASTQSAPPGRRHDSETAPWIRQTATPGSHTHPAILTHQRPRQSRHGLSGS
jgi:hypothetical protein